MTTPASEEREYLGFRVRAAGNLHAVAAEAIDRLGLPRSAAILDVGAGEGAFSARLIQHGYSQIEAVELVPGRFRVPAVTCHNADIEDPSLAERLQGRFDAVVALELIEHVENPAACLRVLARCLRPGGHVVLSTPNVTSWRSRLMFLRHGELHWFNRARHEKDGHVHPMFDWQVRAFGERAGLRVVSKTHTSDALMRVKYGAGGSGRFSFSRTAMLYRLFRPLMQGDAEGELNLWVLQRG